MSKSNIVIWYLSFKYHKVNYLLEFLFKHPGFGKFPPSCIHPALISFNNEKHY